MRGSRLEILSEKSLTGQLINKITLDKTHEAQQATALTSDRKLPKESTTRDRAKIESVSFPHEFQPSLSSGVFWRWRVMVHVARPDGKRNYGNAICELKHTRSRDT